MKRSLTMIFEWDEEKSERNYRERGFGFDAAVQIFADRTIEWVDDRHDYGEVRMIAIGAMASEEMTTAEAPGAIVLVVVYTDRGEVRRIISARKAKQKERELWVLFASP